MAFIKNYFLLSFNTKTGSKLLLTDVIPIKDGFLQLNHNNTQYQYGSNTYSRPRTTRRVSIDLI